MKRKKSILKKKGIATKVKIGAAIATAALAAGSFFWITTGKGNKVRFPAYTALRVIDGDTFETNENQRIRLASSDAPELDLCGGRQAKEALEKMIMGKPLYIKVVYNDQYNRLVGYVYTEKIYVNKELVEKGFAYYRTEGHNTNRDEFRQSAEIARKKKLGIHGSDCTQTENPKNKKCNIKGNIGVGNKYYFTTNCKIYSNVIMQTFQGDQWFCTEKEAKKAGFKLAPQCP